MTTIRTIYISIPEIFEVGMSHGLLGGDSLVRIIRTHPVNEFAAFWRAVLQMTLEACAFFGREVEVYTSGFTGIIPWRLTISAEPHEIETRRPSSVRVASIFVLNARISLKF